jgi:hypothetical protein
VRDPERHAAAAGLIAVPRSEIEQQLRNAHGGVVRREMHEAIRKHPESERDGLKPQVRCLRVRPEKSLE